MIMEGMQLNRYKLRALLTGVDNLEDLSENQSGEMADSQLKVVEQGMWAVGVSAGTGGSVLQSVARAMQADPANLLHALIPISNT